MNPTPYNSSLLKLKSVLRSGGINVFIFHFKLLKNIYILKINYIRSDSSLLGSDNTWSCGRVLRHYKP
jgi:hypothetical protein